MTCRSCAAEIDDKAIMCYRCGAPTAQPAVRRSAPAAAGRWRWGVAIVAALVAIAVYWFVFRAAGPA